MRTTKAAMIAVTAIFLAAGLAQAASETAQSAAQPVRTSVQKQATANSRAQVDGVFYARKAAKACTYRGGPKTGIWDCR